jgi:hypothetical protein
MYTEILNNINKLCGPSYIYFIISSFILSIALINSAISRKINFVKLVTRLLTISLITFFLHWLCKIGYTNFSWFLLYWMFALVLIVLIGCFYIISIITKNLKCENMKGILEISQSQIQN